LATLQDPFEPDYLVPWDASAQPEASVDIVLSRAVLEHVPEESIRFFFQHFHRILRPAGTMCHVIDNSDHWQHRDRSLSRVSFLQHEEQNWLWRLAQVNEQTYQNRLRHGDYLRLLSDAGFVVMSEVGRPDPQCLKDLRSLPLASRFKDHGAHDLAILTSLFVAQRA
jgi:cyclopropane fatty-acyl-phospholipid synthase-like methyltransferase